MGLANGHTHAEKHILVVSSHLFGHFRGLLSTCCALVRLNTDLVVTYIIHAFAAPLAQQVIGQWNLTPDEAVRLRFVAALEAVPPPPDDPAKFFRDINAFVLDKEWDNIFNSKPYCGFSAIREPDAIFADYFCSQVNDKAISEKRKAKPFVDAEFITGSSWQLQQAREKIATVAETPGHPSLNDYELILPATVPWPSDLIDDVEKTANKNLLAGHYNVISHFSRVLAPRTADGWNKLLNPHGNRVLEVSTSYAPSFWEPTPVFPEDSEVFQFLNKQEQLHGPKSVVYVSFGTLFFPVTKPWMADALIDALVDSKTPFVFVMAALSLNFLPDQGASIKEKVLRSGNLATAWIDQQNIFKHPAIGYVVTHGGFNSTIEALIWGKPLIMWPMGAEQPANAALVALELDAGFELIQHRDAIIGRRLRNYPDIEIKATPEALGAELKELMVQMKGAVGERKRANAEEASRVLHEEHNAKWEGYLRELLAMI